MALVKEILGSKKALATIVAILVWVLGRVGFDVSEEVLLPVVGSIAAFVLAQGWADSGKEAAKVAAATLAKDQPADPPQAPSP